jgi:hypothetical protein
MLLAKITERWPAKVLSVAAALIISIFHQMNSLESRVFSSSLRVELGDTLIPANLYTEVIRVSLRGEAATIKSVLDDDIETYVDLKKYTTEGSYQAAVQIRKKGSALGVEPLEISVDPPEIPLILERKLSRNISVIPIFHGMPAEGYELVSQSLTPAVVTAEGPRSVLESKNEFQTEVIDLERRYEDFSVMVPIINNEPLLLLRGNGIIEYRGVIGRVKNEVPAEDEDQ